MHIKFLGKDQGLHIVEIEGVHQKITDEQLAALEGVHEVLPDPEPATISEVFPAPVSEVPVETPVETAEDHSPEAEK